MAQHLEICPASIVCCTMEWNRWPVSYADRKSYENLSKDFDEVEQLDMALALQDQRMLLESLKVTTTVSKNGEKKEDEEDDEESDKMAMSSNEAAVEMEQDEPYSELYKASVETNRSLAAALDILSNSKEIEVIVEKKRYMQDSDSLDSDCELGAVGGVDCGVGTEQNHVDWADENEFAEILFDENVVNEEPRGNGDVLGEVYLPILPLNLPLSLTTNLCPNNFMQHLPSELRYRCLERKLQSVEVLRGISMFTFNGRRALLSDPYLFRAKMEDKSVDTSDLEVADDPMGLHGIDLITAALLFCLGDSPGGRGISDSRFVDGYHIDFGTQTFSFPSAILATNTMVGDIASASACDHASPQLCNPSPFHTLRLDLVLECVARYQTKQRSMFTFVCGQLFRRDEFSSHFKNVHGDIHAGLNGWMEQRCPLAYYGCTYSQRRFCPQVQGFRIIHDRHLGSFGRHGHKFSSDQFSGLPFEVLQYVASFLDSFSLCQLSRVSRTMREVCASLLQMRGMVVMLWEKRRNEDGSPSWQITDKVWRFSTAFGTVNEWKFANIASMADHLKKCKFNTIARREEAIPLPCMCFTRELTKEGRCLRSVLKPVA
ncbi:hypothetical protein WMY93_016537 [Mugilogobius chulae]|uniref:F-box domain-containing protein n=1 Tax=Mugilogobius chulae TaxID=88201 RepID=A0AAW0NKK2_9GOBI